PQPGTSAAMIYTQSTPRFCETPLQSQASFPQRTVPSMRDLPLNLCQPVAESPRSAAMMAQEFGVPLLDLAGFDLQLCPHHLVDDKLLCKHQVLPLYRRGNRLYLATM